MATIEDVAERFRTRIKSDSPKQMEKAGALWPNLPFNFFYLSHAEDVVDIVVKDITQQMAEENGLTLPDFVFQNLEDMVGPKTPVKDGVRLVFLTIFAP
jgi:hypothetical protein